MFKHNFLLVLRYIRSKKIYASVIMLSLIVGFVCANLMISFLIGEVTADQHYKNAYRTYQIFSDDPFDKDKKMPFILEDFSNYLTRSYPEIQGACQISMANGLTVSNETLILEHPKIVASDSSVFSFFDFIGIDNKLHPFEKKNVILAKEKAIAMFGTGDAIGKVLTIRSDTSVQLIVSGVFERSDARSHLDIEVIIHRDLLPVLRSKHPETPGGPSYIFVEDQSTASALAGKINSDENRPALLGKGGSNYYLSPLKDSYFNQANSYDFMNTRNPVFVIVGYFICGLVLFISTFNFINLFLLFYQDRQKDVGIKKTMGITWAGLLNFSMIEAGIYVVISYGVSLLAAYLLIPVFNTVFEATLSGSYFLNIKVMSSIGVVVFLSAAIVVCLGVGRQWKMKPAGLMTGVSQKLRFNGVLFSLQFVIAIALAVCSVTIIQQMYYLEHAPLGLNRNIIQLESPNKEFRDKMPFLKQKLLELKGVQNVSTANGNPISGTWSVRYDLDNSGFYVPLLFNGDEDFLKTLDLHLLLGKMPKPGSTDRLVNETLVKQFAMKNPIGEKIPGTKDELISGVVRDFTCGSFRTAIPPVIISIVESSGMVLIDYSGQRLSELLPAIKAVWYGVIPDFQFNYRVIQDDLMIKYKEDTQFYRIVVTLSAVCITLSCFGLFALSWAVIQNRTREIGIRKVLGATPADVLNLLTITFTKRIAIAFLIGTPVAYYLIDQWLAGFANRISLNIWIFVVPALIVVMVSMLTLGFQTIKAMQTNPVDEIRNN